MGHQSYVLLCTKTILSTPPVVQPKSSCDVHLLRSPCISLVALYIYIYLPPTLFKNTPSRYLIKQIFYEKAELLTYSTSIFSVYSTVADMDGTFDKVYISESVQ